MVVRTQSGSIYTFVTKDGKIYMLYKTNEYVVDKIGLGIGIPLEIRCHGLNSLTYTEESEPILVTSTPVVEIII